MNWRYEKWLWVVLGATLGMYAAHGHAEGLDPELEKLTGKWSRDADGETIVFQPAMFGWEVQHSRYGQMAVTLTTDFGAQIKVSGRLPAGGPLDCYYRVNMIGKGDTAHLNLLQGPAEECGKGKVVHTWTPQPPRMLTHAQEIAEAASYRQVTVEKSKSGPSDLKNIDTVYFERPSDGSKIRDALDLDNVAFTTRPSDSGLASNTVTCTRDVPIEATKALLRTLVTARVPIRVVRPSQYQQYAKRLTVESLDQWVPSQKLITTAEIDALTTCNLHNKDGNRLIEPPSALPGQVVQARVHVSFPTDNLRPVSFARPAPQTFAAPPPRTTAEPGEPAIPASLDTRVPIEITPVNCSNPVNVTAKFWSPATGSWQMSHLKGIYGPTRFKNGDGTDVTTSTREIYFFMRDTVTQQPVTLSRQRVTYFPGSDTGYYKGGPSFAMRCGG